MRMQLSHRKRWKGDRGREREAGVLGSLVSALLGAHLHSCHYLTVLEKKKNSLYNPRLAWHSQLVLGVLLLNTNNFTECQHQKKATM